MMMAMMGFGMGVATLEVAINSDTADANLFTLAGSPSSAVNVICAIAAGFGAYQSSALPDYGPARFLPALPIRPAASRCQ